MDDLIKKMRLAEKVLCNPQPESEWLETDSASNVMNDKDKSYWCGADHVVIRHNAQLPPTINHGQQTKMIVGCLLMRYLS